MVSDEEVKCVFFDYLFIQMNELALNMMPHKLWLFFSQLSCLCFENGIILSYKFIQENDFCLENSPLPVFKDICHKGQNSLQVLLKNKKENSINKKKIHV